MFAVIAGLVFAIPWASAVANLLGGDAEAAPVLWHELHAVAGAGFVLALLELRNRYRGWFETRGRILLSLAVAGAVAFTAANVGELLGLGGSFIPLYGVALIGLSLGLVGVGLTTRTLPAPLPVLLVATGLGFPAALTLALIGPVVGFAGLMGYGLLWAGLGFVQLSRNP